MLVGKERGAAIKGKGKEEGGGARLEERNSKEFESLHFNSQNIKTQGAIRTQPMQQGAKKNFFQNEIDNRICEVSTDTLF